MMTSSNGNLFRVTGTLWWETTENRTAYQWTSLTKASDTELWCFLWSASEQTVERTIEMLVIWDAITLIMTSLWCRNVIVLMKSLSLASPEVVTMANCTTANDESFMKNDGISIWVLWSMFSVFCLSLCVSQCIILSQGSSGYSVSCTWYTVMSLI